MGLNKEVEFEIGSRTYRVAKTLGNTYDIHGFNSLTQQVSIDTDLNTGENPTMESPSWHIASQ